MRHNAARAHARAPFQTPEDTRKVACKWTTLEEQTRTGAIFSAARKKKGESHHAINTNHNARKPHSVGRCPAPSQTMPHTMPGVGYTTTTATSGRKSTCRGRLHQATILSVLTVSTGTCHIVGRRPRASPLRGQRVLQTSLIRALRLTTKDLAGRVRSRAGYAKHDGAQNLSFIGKIAARPQQNRKKRALDRKNTHQRDAKVNPAAATAQMEFSALAARRGDTVRDYYEALLRHTPEASHRKIR